MKHKLNIICTYLGAATLGAYAVCQFKFHEPVALWRWLFTGFWFIYFILQIKYEENETIK